MSTKSRRGGQHSAGAGRARQLSTANDEDETNTKLVHKRDVLQDALQHRLVLHNLAGDDEHKRAPAVARDIWRRLMWASEEQSQESEMMSVRAGLQAARWRRPLQRQSRSGWQYRQVKSQLAARCLAEHTASYCLLHCATTSNAAQSEPAR